MGKYSQDEYKRASGDEIEDDDDTVGSEGTGAGDANRPDNTDTNAVDGPTGGH